MTSPFSRSLKSKLWRSRRSASPGKISIGNTSSWPVRLLRTLVTLIAGGIISLWIYSLQGHVVEFNPNVYREQLSVAKEQLEKLRNERDQYSSTVNSAESEINIERSAQKQLMMQVKAMEAENTKLKEDLAFFESLLPADTGPVGVSIRRIKADIAAPNQLRYQLLLMQGGKGERQFVGDLQFAVSVLQAGKSSTIIFPDGRPAEAEKFKLSFKHYQRVEGVLTLPEGAVIKSMQARILNNGQMRTQMTATL